LRNPGFIIPLQVPEKSFYLKNTGSMCVFSELFSGFFVPKNYPSFFKPKKLFQLNEIAFTDKLTKNQ
jgi:hypothetical protein